MLARHWSHLSLRGKGALVVAIPLTALFVFALLAHNANRREASAAAWTDHTHQVRTNIQTLYTLVAEANNGVRGFLLSERPSFLTPYRQAAATLPGVLSELVQLVQDNPSQRDRAERAGRLVTRQLERLAALRQRGLSLPSTALERELAAGKRELDELRRLLERMSRAEEALLAARNERLRQAQAWQEQAVLLNLLFGLVGGLAGTQLFVRGIVNRVEAVEANAKRLAQGQPLRAPLPGTDALSRLGEALSVTAAQLSAQTQRLRESETLLRNVVTNAPIILNALDSEGIFTFSEGRGLETLGRKPGELVGRSVFEVYRDDPEILEDNRRALTGERLTATVDIAGFTFEARFLPTFAGGEVSGVVVVATDVTERKQAEDRLLRYQGVLEQQNAELARADTLKDEFLATMSHELRTPLTAVIGYSELLRDPAFSGATAAQRDEYLAIIAESGHHLLALINDLLDVSKIEAGMMELHPVPLDLRATVTAALALIEGQARKKDQCLTATVPPGLAPLSADARKVKQILYNLLANAVKYTPSEGEIRLEVFDDETEVRVEVQDTGPGITPEDQARLFRPFVQLRNPQADAFDGTGLGLVLTKQLVELHGGRMWLRSRAGMGSTFGFSLPRTAQTPDLGPRPVN